MRVKSCAGKCSKVLLLLVNIVIFLAGGGLLGLGIYYHLDGGLYEHVLNVNDIITVPTTMMFLGCLFLIISFFAIVGALCEVVIMLKIYMSIVAIVLILEVLLMGVCVAMRGDVEKRAVLVIHNLMEHYGNKTSDDLSIITKTIDETQIWLSCCGLERPGDWGDPEIAKYWAATNNPNSTLNFELPLSCCRDRAATSCAYTNTTEGHKLYYSAGCRAQFEEFVEGNVTYITVGGIVMIVLQVFVMISALKIRFELSSKYDQDDYLGNSANMEITSL